MKMLLWQQRKNKNLTLEELSNLSEVSVSELNAIENHKAIPRLDTAIRIAEALKVDIQELYEL